MPARPVAEIDRPMGERDLDAEFVEAQFHAPIEGPPHGPLGPRPDLDAGPDDDRRIVQAVDALDLQGLQDVVSEIGVLHHLGADLLDHRHHLVDVFGVADADVEDRIGEFLGVVEDGADIAERDRMNAAGGIAEAQGADGHRLDGARMAGDVDIVAEGDRILDEDEEAGDDVLDQGLGTETDSQADNPGAGQQRRDVDAEFGQDDQHHHDGEGDEDDIAQQGQ